MKLFKKKKIHKKKSFYDTDEFDTESSGFYKDSDEDTPIEHEDISKRLVFKFKWWEYLIIIIEFLLLIYAFLVFFNIVPLF